MKKKLYYHKILKKILCIWVLILTINLPQFIVNAGIKTDSVLKADSVILNVRIGSGAGELGCSSPIGGNGNGPESFVVTDDGTIYIIDNVNKRVNVYRDGEFLYDIETPYIAYVRSMVVSQGNIYLMDFDAGKIYAVDAKGKLIKDISLPVGMVYYKMCQLYVQEDSSVWLYYEDGCSYSVDDLADGKTVYMEGFTKDSAKVYSISGRSQKSASLNRYNTAASPAGRAQRSSIPVATKEFLGQMTILDADRSGSVFVDVYEQLNTSIVAGEYTVRKYLDNGCTEIASIDLEPYYFRPNNVLEISEAGELYQLMCYEDSIQIIKKAFIAADEFQSDINNIKKNVLAEEEAERAKSVAATINAPNDLNTTMSNAIDCCNLTWTYNAANANNPNPDAVTKPPYLAAASTPSTQTGIPYCWGGFDGISTSSAPRSWSNFSDAMAHNAFAGNVNTDSYYKSGTAGFDCSGYVSSTAGFSSKLGTSNLASNTYTREIELRYRSAYDIYVKSGSHVLYFIEETNNGIRTREATTDGTAKTKLYTRQTSSLAGYTLRRFNGW